MVVIQRDGDRDLQFDGEVIGEGVWGDETTNLVRVSVYRLKNNAPETNEPRYVVNSRLTYRTDGNDSADVRHNAKVCIGPKAVLEALMHQGRLGKASKDAWESACDTDPDLSDERYEVL